MTKLTERSDLSQARQGQGLRAKGQGLRAKGQGPRAKGQVSLFTVLAGQHTRLVAPFGGDAAISGRRGIMAAAKPPVDKAPPGQGAVSRVSPVGCSPKASDPVTALWAVYRR